MNSLAALAVAGHVTPSSGDDAEHLRRLIEKQPCCLLRVGLDGELLAANDAALQELGERDLGQALGRPFTDWVVADDHELWHEFVAEVRDSGSGSEECELAGLERARHPVQLTGVVLTDHPDGIASVLLVVRDISSTRRLEHALHDHARTRRALADLRQQLEQALTAQLEVRKAIEERDAIIRRLTAERSALHEQVKLLRWRLEGAAAEQGRLGELLEEQARQRKTLVATHSAEREEAGRALAAAMMEKEQAVKALAGQIEEILAEANRAATLARQYARDTSSEVVDPPLDSGGSEDVAASTPR